MTARFISNAEWRAATQPPITSSRELTDADRQEAIALSSSIGRGVQAALRQAEDFRARPVTMADLLALKKDKWKEPLRVAAATVAAARKAEVRLRFLLGDDATLPDDGWPGGIGQEAISLATISEALAAAEAATREALA